MAEKMTVEPMMMPDVFAETRKHEGLHARDAGEAGGAQVAAHAP